MKKFGYVFNDDGEAVLVNTDCIARVSVAGAVFDTWHFDVLFTDGTKMVACLTIADEEIDEGEDYKAINSFMKFLGRLDDVQQY